MADNNQLLEKNEVTISDIAEEEQNRDKMLTFGVIIDVSEPFRYDNRDEYVTKLKVIDPSFNYKAYINNPNIKPRSLLHVKCIYILIRSVGIFRLFSADSIRLFVKAWALTSGIKILF